MSRTLGLARARASRCRTAAPPHRSAAAPLHRRKAPHAARSDAVPQRGGAVAAGVPQCHRSPTPRPRLLSDTHPLGSVHRASNTIRSPQSAVCSLKVRAQIPQTQSHPRGDYARPRGAAAAAADAARKAARCMRMPVCLRRSTRQVQCLAVCSSAALRSARLRGCRGVRVRRCAGVHGRCRRRRAEGRGRKAEVQEEEGAISSSRRGLRRWPASPAGLTATLNLP